MFFLFHIAMGMAASEQYVSAIIGYMVIRHKRREGRVGESERADKFSSFTSSIVQHNFISQH